MIRRLLLAAVAFLAAALAAGLWISRLFSEPGAVAVPSLAGALGAQRVLGVFAHPDDEQLVTGLFARAKTHDAAFTALVTATEGDAGEQAPVIARQRDLGSVRKAELLKNGFALGIDEQEVWEYPDGDVPQVPLDELVARIERAILAYEPDLVVTFWPASGATGHDDHMRVGLATEAAVNGVRSVSAPDYAGPRWIAFALTPRRALARLGGESGRFVAEHSPDPTHRMPGEVSAKRRGWKIHASQEDYVQREYGVPAWLLYLLWDEEVYRVVDLDARG